MILQLVLIQILTFGLIVFFLRWLFYGHISRALKRLQKLNQENLEKEKALKEEFERAKREAEREIELGKSQAEEIREHARQDAEKDREEVVSKARKEATRLINEAVRECQRKKTEMTVEMQEKAVYLAFDMIKYIFTEHGQEELHAQIVNEMIAEIEKLDDAKIQVTGDMAELICAFPLREEQRKSLKRVLTAKLHREVDFMERIDKEMIAGVNIKLGGFVIDGSMKNRFKKILHLMKEKAKE